MAKRRLMPDEVSDLRQALQIAVLDALMASRRWQPGELIFQGGTGLHLAHGSPRYSEDLDFLVESSLNLDALGKAIQGRLGAIDWLPVGTALTASEGKGENNPRRIVTILAGPEVIGTVRVSVELWQTAAMAMSSVKFVVAAVRMARGPAAGIQTFVPTAELAEIFADKVFALGGRPYLKPRDVFDLQWLSAHENIGPITADDFLVRLATYPAETPAGWLPKATTRRRELPESIPAIATDLKRWLPSSWPLDDAGVGSMVNTAVAALDRGIAVMREIEEEGTKGHVSPRP